MASSALRCGGDAATEAARDAILLLLCHSRTVDRTMVAEKAGELKTHLDFKELIETPI